MKKLQSSIRNVATKSLRVATKLHCTYIRIIDQISTQLDQAFFEAAFEILISLLYM